MKMQKLYFIPAALLMIGCGEEGHEKAESIVDVVVNEEKVKQVEEPLRAESPADINLREGEEFLAENGQRSEVTTLESGVQYEILAEGDGAIPTMANNVTVHYHGTHLDGSVFDSSVDRNDPFTHNMSDPLITGWVEALLLMTEGSKWRVFMPAESAYGPYGSPPAIGPNEALIFEIELIKING